MITVAGFNTSIDKYVETGELRVGEVNRVWNAESAPGGKGAHVALACASLGEPVRLVGVIDASHADRFRTALADHQVQFESVEVEGEIRTCLAVRGRDAGVTELLEIGPEIDEAARAMLAASVLNAAAPGQVTVFSGSVPPGVSDAAYGELIGRVRGSEALTLVDASAGLLCEALRARPFVVKVNAREASEVTEHDIEDSKDAVDAVRWLVSQGAARAVVSLGPDGVVALWEDRIARISAPAQQVRNSVGAGDCLPAGIAVGLTRRLDANQTLRLGVACGAAKTNVWRSGCCNGRMWRRCSAKCGWSGLTESVRALP